MMGLRLFSGFYGKAVSAARRRALRASPPFSAARRFPIPRGFFDDYPLFFSTSQTGPAPNRLNQRYRACIEWNEPAIRGQRVLDLASHDGRWSFAAIKAGAINAVGNRGARLPHPGGGRQSAQLWDFGKFFSVYRGRCL